MGSEDNVSTTVYEVPESLNLSTYGDAGPLSVGEPWAADPCLGLLDIRGGEKLEVLFGGAKDGRFLGLGLRVGCGDDKGAAADATAVDMVGDNDSSSSGYGITMQMRQSKVLVCDNSRDARASGVRERSGKRIETWDRPGRYIKESRESQMERRAVRRQAAV